MASASHLSAHHLRCSICLDVFNDPVSTPCGHNFCKVCITRYWDTSAVCKCPLCKKTFYITPAVSVNTLLSELVQLLNHKLGEDYVAKAEAEVQQMIQERRGKIQEVKSWVELSRKKADAVIGAGVQLFAALTSCIERSRDALIDEIEEKQKTTEIEAGFFIKDLEQEVTKLEKRISDLKEIPVTEDHDHLLQNLTSESITEWRPKMDLTKVCLHQLSHSGTLRTAMSQLEKRLSQEMKEQLSAVCAAELRRIQQYEVDVTLDSGTAQGELMISQDNKQVSLGFSQKYLPDKKERFSNYVDVLGKQGFSSGRSYYEVQVAGKTDWALGVAGGPIRSKGVKLNPSNGYWTIVLRTGRGYFAADDHHNVLFPVRECPRKVGVLVDYVERLVSFYDVENQVPLFSFTGCNFPGTVFPFFSPGLHDGGRNSAPLVISPVNRGNGLNNVADGSNAEAGGPLGGGPSGGPPGEPAGRLAYKRGAVSVKRSATKRPRLSP